MSTISEKLKFETRYTNHCIRVTGITNLHRARFSAKQVMSVSGHKSVASLAIYERIQEDKKLMMGMCLSFSLLHPEDAIMIHNSVNLPEIEPQPQEIKALPTLKAISTNSPIQEKSLLPLENAIAPYQPKPPADENEKKILISAIIAEVQNDEIPDEDMVLAATQCEQSITENSVMPPTTSTKSSVMRRSTTTYPSQTFSGCTFGSIGTINIHIHKH